ncbi:MAG: hypothetical protein ABS75_01000 [Pelagibacterium sp. SCN 63-23]|nr:MAG: hypothetical protein ABS75_01000 [Pelagibacterium sp. SCN 63-23]
MNLDTIGLSAGGHRLKPMQIARHTLFTAREKLDLLGQLRDRATDADREDEAAGFAVSEIEAAIIQVREGAARSIAGANMPRGG